MNFLVQFPTPFPLPHFLTALVNFVTTLLVRLSKFCCEVRKYGQDFEFGNYLQSTFLHNHKSLSEDWNGRTVPMKILTIFWADSEILAKINRSIKLPKSSALAQLSKIGLVCRSEVWVSLLSNRPIVGFFF